MKSARRQTDRGAVLLIVLLVMMAILGLGMTTLWLTSSTLMSGASISLRAQTLYVAEAGIERAREIMGKATSADINMLLAGGRSTLDNVPSALLPTGEPDGVGAVLADLWTPALLPVQNVAFPPASFARPAGPMGNYTVWIRNDNSECRMNNFTADANNAIVIRSVATAPDNRTSVALEVTFYRGASAASGGAGFSASDICASGKNACEDNTATLRGVAAM